MLHPRKQVKEPFPQRTDGRTVNEGGETRFETPRSGLFVSLTRSDAKARLMGE